MRRITWLILAAMAIGGCQQIDENPDWNPQVDLPSWAYDAPIYYRPSEDLQMLETVGDDIGVYYSKSDYFFIRHPSGYQLTGGPRIGLWYSPDAGLNWQKAGYFGIEQTHFLFKAAGDGHQWIRFVGPAQGQADVPPGQPHRIYVVDTAPPSINISVDPPVYTVDEQGNEIRTIYAVGQAVTLYWGISDANLVSDSARLGVTFADFPHNVVWSNWPEALGDSGSMQVEIPPEAVDDGGLRFRLEARDKAGNMGVAFTERLIIEGQTPRPIQTTRPSDLLRQSGGRASAKPGWPMAGELLRGGQSRVLGWLPAQAKDYPVVSLQFSSNDGRTWRTVADGIVPGKTARWTVPEVISERCRLRVAHIVDFQEAYVLAVSGLFAVDTIGTDTIKTD